VSSSNVVKIVDCHTISVIDGAGGLTASAHHHESYGGLVEIALKNGQIFISTGRSMACPVISSLAA